VIAAVQVADAIKILSGNAGSVEARLLSADVWENRYHSTRLGDPDPDCAACGRSEYRYLNGERRPQITLCGRNSVQIHENHRPVDLAALATRLSQLGTVRATEHLLKFSAAPFELTLFPDGRAIIKGTSDPALARSVYARFVGT
jgi:adenylyltransferase/sulfurtransferase